jgi:hypothetical protein
MSILTFLFTDIEGSTRRWEADADPMQMALVTHNQVLRDAVDANDGRVFNYSGAGMCAVFTSPRSAVDAAVEAQLTLELPVRMGVATGEAELPRDRATQRQPRTRVLPCGKPCEARCKPWRIHGRPGEFAICDPGLARLWRLPDHDQRTRGACRPVGSAGTLRISRHLEHSWRFPLFVGDLSRVPGDGRERAQSAHKLRRVVCRHARSRVVKRASRLRRGDASARRTHP